MAEITFVNRFYSYQMALKYRLNYMIDQERSFKTCF